MSAKPIYEFDKRTSSTDAVPSALQGSVYWYDTGTTLNGESVYYESTDTYALWYNGTNRVISAIADVDGSPTDYFYEYSDTTQIEGRTVTDNVEVVGFDYDTGTLDAVYDRSGMYNDRPQWYAEINYLGSLQDFYVRYDSATNKWLIYWDDLSTVAAQVESTAFTPPKDGWEAQIVGLDDPSVLVGFIPQGAWSGDVVINENTIAESWNKAERNVFESLIDFLGCTENSNAFRGRYPTNEDGNPKWRNVWMINSGGSAGAYDTERTYGLDGNWCNAMINCEVRGLFRTRVLAMNFASSVLAWLKHTNNMNETGNVGWCMLTDLPSAPEPIVIENDLQWEVIIPLQILYLTEGEY